MRKKILLAALIFAALLGIVLSVRTGKIAETGNTNSTISETAGLNVTLVLDIGAGSPTSYPVENLTDATAFGALKSTAQANGIELQYDPPGQYGVFVKSIAGLAGSSEKFWIYQVNGVDGQVAADQMAVKIGDTVTWKYTTASN